MPPPVPRGALLLSGCGVHDGSEIHEAVLAMLALDRAGARIIWTAPDTAQAHVVDHQRGEIAPNASRNVRIESARIARGPVADVADLSVRDLDALVVPGGYGVTKNLSDYAFRARAMEVHPAVAKLIRDMHDARKPMAFLCTAPVVAARVLGRARPRLTIGRDIAVAEDIASFGAIHEPADARGIVVDREQRIVSTPAYMLAQRISDAAVGIDQAIRAMLELR
jgi:enhancing lycopene biosynthesis protein 2